jgi:hypothetical protein
MRPGVLFSLVQDKDIEVTSSNITTALKCNDEHTEGDAQLDEQPPTFYVAEIIDDMCVVRR